MWKNLGVKVLAHIQMIKKGCSYDSDCTPQTDSIPNFCRCPGCGDVYTFPRSTTATTTIPNTYGNGAKTTS